MCIGSGDEEVTDEDIDRAMRQMDGDGSGEVDFDECVSNHSSTVMSVDAVIHSHPCTFACSNVRVHRFLEWWRIGRLQPRGVHFKEGPVDGASSPKPEGNNRKLTRQATKDQMAMLSSRDDFDDNLRSIFVRHRFVLCSR